MKINWKTLKKIAGQTKYQLALILLLAFVVRLYRITNPVLDWHAFRQADTASVTHQYVLHGVDLLQPKYHDLSNIQSGLENPNGYRMVEFPLVNGLTAGVIRELGNINLEITSRLISILFSLGALYCLYWFVKEISHQKLALLSLIIMAFMPFSVYYSRVVLPEPALLFFSMFSLASFVQFLKNDRIIFWWLSWMGLALALLLKPFVAFYAPAYLALLMIYDQQWWKKVHVYLFPILAFIPLAWWRNWIKQFPEGIPASTWLLNSDGIRLRPAWFRWLFWERIGLLMSGGIGIIFLIANAFKRNRILLILAAWWIGILGYFVVIATGNVRHDYYQVLVIPLVSITLARGALIFHQKLAAYLKTKIILWRYFSLITTALLIGSMFAFSWFKIKGYYNVNHWEYLKAGQAADKLLPADAKVIAHAMGDTMFLFQTRRTGWPIGFDIEKKITAGATHYVTTEFNYEAEELEKKYTTIKKTSEYLIIDLTKIRQ